MPNKRQAGKHPNQWYFLSQSPTNCLFICFLQMKGVLLCNNGSGEICLLIKMLQIVFRRLSILCTCCVGNNDPHSVRGKTQSVCCFISGTWPWLPKVMTNISQWEKRGILCEQGHMMLYTVVHLPLLDFTIKGRKEYTLAGTIKKYIYNRGIWIIYLHHNPAGNVLGIYILSSRTLDEVSQQSTMTHFHHVFLYNGSNGEHPFFHQYIYPLRRQKEKLMKMLHDISVFPQHNGQPRSIGSTVSWWQGSEGLASHNGFSVYSRQPSFLPTIMREIESQEMFVFLSISSNNNNIPNGLQKPLSSKDSPEN